MCQTYDSLRRAILPKCSTCATCRWGPNHEKKVRTNDAAR